MKCNGVKLLLQSRGLVEPAELCQGLTLVSAMCVSVTSDVIIPQPPTMNRWFK